MKVAGSRTTRSTDLILGVSHDPLGGQVRGTGLLSPEEFPLLLDEGEMAEPMKAPECLEGFQWSQPSGQVPVDSPEGLSPDSTYFVEAIQFLSEGSRINGWLYRPMREGPMPLVVLTNGGENDERVIKSPSNFLAPHLAYCGFAAFVNDKRGTGASEGVFRATDYEDYIVDTGNAALTLAEDPRIDADRIGVLGGSEGGRIAVLAASQSPVFKFVISLMGPTTSLVEDRFLVETNGARIRTPGLEDWTEVDAVWRALIEAHATGNPEAVAQMDEMIIHARRRLPGGVLPFTSRQAASNPHAEQFVPTWTSLKYEYVS